MFTVVSEKYLNRILYPHGMNIDKKKFSFDFLGSISFKEKLK